MPSLVVCSARSVRANTFASRSPGDRRRHASSSIGSVYSSGCRRGRFIYWDDSAVALGALPLIVEDFDALCIDVVDPVALAADGSEALDEVGGLFKVAFDRNSV